MFKPLQRLANPPFVPRRRARSADCRTYYNTLPTIPEVPEDNAVLSDDDQSHESLISDLYDSDNTEFEFGYESDQSKP